MAVRAPTDFTAYVDDDAFQPRERVLTTEPDNILDDQVFLYDKNEIILTDMFNSEWTSGAGFQEVGRYFLRGIDVEQATINCQFAVYAFASSLANFDVRLNHIGRGVQHTINVTATQSTAQWRGWATCVLYGDGTENEIALEVDRNAASNVVVTGCCIFTDY